MHGTDALKSRTIFCFWTGDNPITERRKYSVECMGEITGKKSSHDNTDILSKNYHTIILKTSAKKI